MDIQNLLSSIQGTLGNSLPGILGALLILIVGWLVAIAIRAGVRRGLKSVGLNKRMGGGFDTESLLSKVAFWVVIAFVMIGVFNALDLAAFSEPLNALVSQVTAFLPKGIAAAVVGLVGWALATGARNVVANGLAQTSLDEKLASEAGVAPVSSNMSNIAYWFSGFTLPTFSARHTWYARFARASAKYGRQFPRSSAEYFCCRSDRIYWLVGSENCP